MPMLRVSSQRASQSKGETDMETKKMARAGSADREQHRASVLSPKDQRQSTVGQDDSDNLARNGSCRDGLFSAPL